MGKAYANRKKVVDNDLYHTPESLTVELLKKEKFKGKILEPACGDMAIVNPLRDHGHNPMFADIERGMDFLEYEEKGCNIITNPPFFLWDDFVNKAKELNSKKFAFIGRGNYFGTVDRFNSGIFQGLKKVYFFNRYIDYRTPRRKDGLFHVGAMLTGWFVWERGYKGLPQIDYIDVQQYAKLGQYRESDYKILDILGISSTWNPDMDIDCDYIMRVLERELKFRYTIYQLKNAKTIIDILRYTRNQTKF